MEAPSYLSAHRKPVSQKGLEAGERATVKLKRAKEIFSLLEDNIKLMENYYSNTQKFVSLLKENSERKTEIITGCLERLKYLKTSLKDSLFVEKHLNFNYEENESVTDSEKQLLQNILERANDESKSDTLKGVGQYGDIDLNNRHEAAYWCKKLNASRPEILAVMEKINTKNWVDVWKYFLNKKKALI